jgi:hypothetical protein
VFNYRDPIHARAGIGFDPLRHFVAISLISFDPQGDLSYEAIVQHLSLSYHNTRFVIEFPNAGQKCV